MAQNAFHFRPPVSVALDTKQIDKPIQIRLEICHSHANESINIPFKPGTHVVDQRHVLKILFTAGICFVYFTNKIQFLNQHVVCCFTVVDDC